MNINQMKQFQVIAKYDSISKASEELFVSPPALSRLISGIENDLNCRLFDRSGRNIYLNDHGKRLVSYIETIITTYDEMLEYFNNISLEPDQPIIVTELCENFLDGIINSFKQKHPYIRIEKKLTSYEKALLLLLKKQANIVFTDELSIKKHQSQMINKHIDTTFLLKNSLFLAVLPDSPYANRKNIMLEELAHEKFVTIEPNDQKNINYLNFVDYVCKANSFDIRYQRSYDSETMAQIAFFTPDLLITDSLHVDFYMEARKHKKYIKIKNESASQNIFICHQHSDLKAKQLTDEIKRSFFKIFNK